VESKVPYAGNNRIEILGHPGFEPGILDHESNTLLVTPSILHVVYKGNNSILRKTKLKFPVSRDLNPGS
jgi:hypothetical protein